MLRWVERSKSLRSLDILRSASILVWDIAMEGLRWLVRTMPTLYHVNTSVHIYQVPFALWSVGMMGLTFEPRML